MDLDKTYASFWEHIDDLRKTFLKVLLILVLSVAICLFFYPYIFSFLTISLKTNSTSDELHVERYELVRVVNPTGYFQTYLLPEKSIVTEKSTTNEIITPNHYRLAPQSVLEYYQAIPKTDSLVILDPLEGILSTLKICLIAGLLISSPLWLWILFQFISPALHKGEKKLFFPFIGGSLLFIAMGMSFAFFITIPFSNQYLMAFNQTLGTNLWSVSTYLDYTLFLLVANGLAFEFGAIGLFGVHLGLIKAESLIRKRKVAMVGALVLGAILTPPDVFTQILLAVPLYGLYEITILYAKFRARFNLVKTNVKAI